MPMLLRNLLWTWKAKLLLLQQHQLRMKNEVRTHLL
jgi:hypothetical protein